MLGRKIIEEAFKYGQKYKCSFAFVETISFQAPEFYQKFGFKTDFIRYDYNKGKSFHYLKKDLS